MKRVIPLIALCGVLLAACNSSSNSSDNDPPADTGGLNGGLNHPAAAATALAPPANGQLPADLIPPS